MSIQSLPHRNVEDIQEAWKSWICNASFYNSSKTDLLLAKIEKIAVKRPHIAEKVKICILQENPQEFIGCAFSEKEISLFPNYVCVPRCFWGISALRDRDLGAGEILILFLFSQSDCFFGNTVDCSIFEKKWHIKQIKRRDRRGRMGESKKSSYAYSNVAKTLSQIDWSMSQEISPKLIQKFSSEICEKFGSINIFWEYFKGEFVQREFVDVEGICFFSEDSKILEFHPKDDVILLGAANGRYKISAAQLNQHQIKD